MTQQNNITEKLLLQRYYQTKNLEFLGKALQLYTPILLGVAMKYVKNQEIAEDLVQQVFLKALQKIPAQLSNLGGWLYMVLKHECMDYLRKGNHTLSIQQEDYTIDLPAEPAEDQDMHWKKVMDEDRIQQLIEHLKPEQKICIQLFYLEEKSYFDICEITGFSMNDVKSYIQNGKRNLKIKFEKEQLP